MSTLDQDIQDAKLLKSKIQSAIKAFQYPPDNCKDEIRVRFNAIYDILIICERDTNAMIDNWQDKQREQRLREVGK